MAEYVASRRHPGANDAADRAVGQDHRCTATKADLATQMLLHEVHHRAQAMAMLRQLGVEAQNLDYTVFAAKREEFLKGAPRG